MKNAAAACLLLVFALYAAACPAQAQSSVKMWEEETVIPTYPIAPPDKNPMFLFERNVQGSRGNVYPLKMTDGLTDTLVDKTYKALFLENEYVKIMVLPELGGRVHVALDKTNNYDFIYRQRSIKPALIGTLGAWISGGIEWNFPQHHRPTTFCPQDYRLVENGDGSKTLWVGEVEPLNRIKGVVGLTLYPGKSCIEAKVRIYNRTPLPQTFLWWVNIGVHVNPDYQVFFPEDVNYGVFHHKNQVVDFPIARTFYSQVDYGRGVDISWYKNIPLPTSYFVEPSTRDFFGGYDHGKKAGLVHCANHWVSPGKKLWTWGTDVYGEVWEKNLTDRDGPYVELMAGVYTDNQPDFSWLRPAEVKTFSQFIYPIREIGPAKMANPDAAVNVEIAGGTAKVGVHATAAHKGATVLLEAAGEVLLNEKVELAPDKPFLKEVPVPAGLAKNDVRLSVVSADKKEIISYAPYAGPLTPLPKPYKENPPPPHDIKTGEELYLTGVHIEQYRHPRSTPEPYYEEALRRDPGDSRVNNAYGLLSLRRADFERAGQRFRRAVKTITLKNFNPYDGEPYYNLGLALFYQGRFGEAYDAFYKGTWSEAWKAAGYYWIAALDCRKGDFPGALDDIESSLSHNTKNSNALALKAAILRRLGLLDKAEKTAREALALDVLDFWSMNELYLAKLPKKEDAEASGILSDLKRLMRDNPESYLDIANGYGNAGLWDEGMDVLGRMARPEDEKAQVYPMIYYYLGYFSLQKGDPEGASRYYRLAPRMPQDYCFPARLEDVEVLRQAQKSNPRDARAFYYLGNLLYDKRQPAEAVKNWETSRELEDSFATVHRNLGQAYDEVEEDLPKAIASYEKAFSLNRDDARVLWELDELYRISGVSPEKRLAVLQENGKLVDRREGLCQSRITLLNQLGRYDEALQLLGSRIFHPWEGGEGGVQREYEFARLSRGRALFKAGDYGKALDDFLAALLSPENLRESVNPKNPGYHCARIHCMAGMAYEALEDGEKAKEFFGKAAAGKDDGGEQAYYTGLALRKLGKEKEASDVFARLIADGRKKLDDKPPSGGSHAVNRWKRENASANLAIGLGNLGLGKKDEAAAFFKKALDADVNCREAALLLAETGQ